MARRVRNNSSTAVADKDELFNRPEKDDDSKKSNTAKPSGGWDTFQKLRDEARSGGDFISGKDDMWKPDEEETLVKFLDDAPFAVYYDVWVPAKNRSYSTLSVDNPLTDRLGLKAQPRVLFNILIFEVVGEDKNGEDVWGWTLKVLRASTMLAELVEKMANHDRFGPLTKGYWEMSASGTKKNYTPIMNFVKERDLPEDWGVDPLTEDDVAEATKADEEGGGLFTIDAVYINPDEDLVAVARELAG